MGIARFDTEFLVQQNNPVRVAGGGTKDNWTDKFSLQGQFKQNNTRKILESGVFVNVTYYDLLFRYEPDKIISISDKVIIKEVEYLPVGDCKIDNIDRPRFYTQTLTLHG